MCTCRLEAEIASAEVARRFIEDALRTDAVGEETLFRAQLLATELVTNAVRHGRSPVELKLARRDGRIRIEARDDCPERPVASAVDSPTRHRGLMLVEDLSEEWGFDVDDGQGKVVWFEVGAT